MPSISHRFIAGQIVEQAAAVRGNSRILHTTGPGQCDVLPDAHALDALANLFDDTGPLVTKTAGHGVSAVPSIAFSPVADAACPSRTTLPPPRRREVELCDRQRSTGLEHGRADRTSASRGEGPELWRQAALDGRVATWSTDTARSVDLIVSSTALALAIGTSLAQGDRRRSRDASRPTS